LATADRLCQVCVDELPVDGAAISLIRGGSTQGTFGSSGSLSRRLDELQFTYGEGPCLDAVATGGPVLVPDLDDPAASRWPTFSAAARADGVVAVFAFPVSAGRAAHVGALDLFKKRAGALAGSDLAGCLLAAELAAVPLLDLMTADVDWNLVEQAQDPWSELETLQRIEVYQATGVVMAQTGSDAVDALLRIRAKAYRMGLTASEVALRIMRKELTFDDDEGPLRSGEQA
jgi:hypothetical protein